MSGTMPALGASLTAPGSINDVRSAAHLKLGQRLGTIDLSPLLVYTVNSAPDSALPFLAWQFDILAPWWQLLAGPSSQRQLIQQAVVLHRFNGTVSAIETVMANLGFGLITILEGQASWGGTQYPPSEGWAVFRVIATKATVVMAPPVVGWDGVTDVDLLINIDETLQASSISPVAVSALEETQAVQAIEFFKPQRAVLDLLWFQELPLEEVVAVRDVLTIVASNTIKESPAAITDFVTVQGWILSDEKTIDPLYNGIFYHTGLMYGPPQAAVIDSGLVIDGSPTE